MALAKPDACPWAAFRDPLVIRALALYRMAGGGTEGGCVPARALALDPPQLDWEALQHYHHAAQAVRANDMQAWAAERKRKADQPRSGTAVTRRG